MFKVERFARWDASRINVAPRQQFSLLKRLINRQSSVIESEVRGGGTTIPPVASITQWKANVVDVHARAYYNTKDKFIWSMHNY